MPRPCQLTSSTAALPLLAVAYGFIAGIISYIIINGSVYLWNLAEVRAWAEK